LKKTRSLKGRARKRKKKFLVRGGEEGNLVSREEGARNQEKGGEPTVRRRGGKVALASKLEGDEKLRASGLERGAEFEEGGAHSKEKKGGHWKDSWE